MLELFLPTKWSTSPNLICIDLKFSIVDHFIDKRALPTLKLKKRGSTTQNLGSFIPSIHFSQPNGCLQYHTGIDGRFTTFNWGGTQHLRNQNYRVCIRQEEGI